MMQPCLFYKNKPLILNQLILEGLSINLLASRRFFVIVLELELQIELGVLFELLIELGIVFVTELELLLELGFVGLS
ncbi:MAG TPA: hypothetical protein VLK78_01760 [Candidatus Angelobacter sp.]|nr:hypothetical protein [Candidatus Angelobacter sp.]